MNMAALLKKCEQELCEREYTFNHQRLIRQYWNEFTQWMQAKGYVYLTLEIGHQYCIEKFGSDILTGIKKADQLKLRSTRMLISYLRDGEFEFRTPSISREFIGETGILMKKYLDYLTLVRKMSNATINNKRYYLLTINNYLNGIGVSIDSIDMETLINFYKINWFSSAKIHNCNSTFRLFLRYVYDTGLTKNDMSYVVMPDNYNRHKKIPTTYEESEIRRILAAVERSSAIGKRDYLILLLAAEYGWRSSDITNFKFCHIDWDKNTIAFNQIKTDAPVIYPLLSSVGNAIIDYIKNGRPNTDSQEIIVSGESSRRGKRLAPPTIHSIVARYIRTAGIDNWKIKKHGPHSLRHSLASNLLKKNVSIPVIATVLGHQNTASTKTYISLDIGQLKKCALPVPKLNTIIFEVAP